MFDLNLSPNGPTEMLTFLSLALEAAAYFIFYYMGRSMNAKRPGQRNIGPRALACIATAVAAAWLMRYTHGLIVDTELYKALTAAEQGAYLGRIWRSVCVPAIVIIGLSAARAWRDKQQRIAQARGAANNQK